MADVGRDVREAVGAGPRHGDGAVVRTEGGDDVFGVDERAESVLIAALRERCGERWPGSLVIEGFDEPVAIGSMGGSWRYIADPVDGSRPWLAGKRSAWVLLGAGRDAATLDALEVGACVELPTARAALSMVAWAVRDSGQPTIVDDHLVTGATLVAEVGPRTDAGLTERSFVSIQRFVPGQKATLGAWEDDVLAGLELYEDPYLCSGGQLMEVVCGRELAVLDPRPLVVEGMAAHPYDLAAWVVAREAGVIVEALPPGPLHYPLDTGTPVAWAAYANEAVAAALRVRLRRAMPAPGRPGTR